MFKVKVDPNVGSILRSISIFYDFRCLGHLNREKKKKQSKFKRPFPALQEGPNSNNTGYPVQ